MREFLRLLFNPHRPGLSASAFARCIGDDLFHALRRAGVLEIVPDPPSAPWLTSEDSSVVVVRRSGFVHLVQRLLGVDGLREPGEIGCAPEYLGRARWAGAVRDVWLSLGVPSPWLVGPHAAGLCRDPLPLVVVSERDVAPHLQTLSASEAAAIVLYLEDVLAVIDGEVQLVREARRQLDLTFRGPGAARSALALKQEPFCLRFDRTGEQWINQIEYDDLCAEADAFDLFIDGMRPVARSYYAAKRDAAGAFIETRLSPIELETLAAVMTQPGVFRLRQGDEKTLRIVQQARHKIDVRLSRYRCVFRPTRPPIPPAPGQPFQSTRARSERSDGIPLRSGLGAHLSQRGDAWMISPCLPSSLRALSTS